MAAYPAFLFYAEDFTAGTAAMSPTAVGIYIRCLCYQWSHGTVPADKGRVGRLAGATKEEIEEAWPEMILKFKVSAEGTMQNQRLEAVRAELIASQKRRTKAGKKGAKVRWQTQCERNAIANAGTMRTGCDDDSKTMASRIEDEDSIESDSENESEYDDDFERFWKVFPRGRKKSKGAAWKSWQQARKTASVEALISAAERYAKSDEGLGAFVKMPSTWLNQHCWTDDPEAWREKNARAGNDPRGNLARLQRRMQDAGGMDVNGNS